MAQVLSHEVKDELFLSCRYGDLEDVEQFVSTHGKETLSDLRDQHGNTVLHMSSANGHIEILDYLLPIVSPSLLSAQNDAKSTALHWAALNSHLAVVQKLVMFPGGPGVNLIDIKNAAGRSPLAEAEMAGFDEGAKWLVEKMRLDTDDGVKEEEHDAEGADEADTPDVEVEIQDADGGVAKMIIGGR